MEKNKRRLYSGFTSLAFVMLGIYLIFTSNEHKINPDIVITIGIISILFFEMVAIISLKDFLSKKK